MPKLKLHNSRLISVMEYLISSKSYAAITNESEFLRSINYPYVSNIAKVKDGSRSFTIEHFISTVKKYNVDANYFFNQDARMFTTQKAKTAIELIKEGVALLEAKNKKI